MENINIKFLDKLDENQLAQEINSIEEINNPEPVIEITPTPITIEEMPQLTLNTIEDMTDPNPVPPINPDENPTGTSQELKPKFVPNTVRYIDGGFPF
jgi:hypothetical protein